MPATPSRRSRPRASQRGMAILWVMGLIAFLAIAAGVALPTLASRVDRSSTIETGERMDVIIQGMEGWVRDHLSLPQSLAELLGGGPGGLYLAPRIEGWAGAESSHARDAWSRPLRWERTSPYRGTLTSAGADGTFDTADDITHVADAGRLLSEITAERLEILNIAITNYNEKEGEEEPLGGSSLNVLSRLQQSGFLPGETAWETDAFGDLWLTIDSPVRALDSKNLE